MTRRRTFLIGSLALGGAAVLGGHRAAARAVPAGGASGEARAAEGAGASTRSRVVVARDRSLRVAPARIDSDRLSRLLDDAMLRYFDVDHPLDAWRRVITPDEVVGLKVNCLAGRGLSTTVALVEAICERLRGIGVPDRRIVIWDRQNSDLEDGGYTIATRGSGVRCFGNDLAGFEPELVSFGSACSLVTKTVTRLCDAVINLPVLKDHGITGVTGALKNLFGAIHNPNKYHLGLGDPYVPDVYCLPPIRNKVRLTIVDALTAQYEGGPSFLAHWSWPYDGLLVGADPVALDRTCWRIIEAKRAQQGMPTLHEAGRQPTYIATAADAAHRLGTNDPARIDLVEYERS